MRIILLTVACLIIGAVVGNRMTHDRDLPGCPVPAVSTTGGHR